jgi:hypothetical protein
MHHRPIVVLLIVPLFCGCSRESKAPDRPPYSWSAEASAARPPVGQPSSEPEREEPALAGYLSFPACGIKVRQPEGFEKADSFDGFGHAETQSSVLAVSFPGPYSKATAGFTQEQMKARGWTLLSREDIKIDGLPGIIVHVEQPAGGVVFLKWSIIFGDDQKTTMVTATFPKAHERDLSARLKSAVLSTRLDSAAPLEPGADLPFTIAASRKLKITPGINKALTYTKDGVIPTRSPRDPLFIVAPSLGKGVVVDKLELAERRLRETATTKALAVKSTVTITIAGLDGYESLAEAEDAKSGTPLIVYQVMLFDDGSYIRMQGLVGTDLRDEYLPEFKAMARSFQRKHP